MQAALPVNDCENVEIMRSAPYSAGKTGTTSTCPFSKTCVFIGKSGAPGGTRTPDPLLRRQMLYPAELQARGLSIVKDFQAKSKYKPCGGSLLPAASVLS